MSRIRELLIVVMVIFLGDLVFGLRLLVPILIAFGAAGVLYVLMLPTELPLWPAIANLAVGGVVGLVWEHRGCRR